MKNKILLIAIATSLISNITVVQAQLFKKRLKDENPPKAILVQLNTESNKINYFLNHNKPEEADRIKNEAAKISIAARNDFKAHFSFCPVYFFADTNYNLIKARKFNGVLLNSDGSIAHDIAITSNDTCYYIAIFGHAQSEVRPTHTNNKVEQDPTYLLGRGLVILDYRFEQLPPTEFHYVYKMDYYDLFAKPDPRYSYKSKKYDMEYYPSANRLNNHIINYFNR